MNQINLNSPPLVIVTGATGWLGQRFVKAISGDSPEIQLRWQGQVPKFRALVTSTEDSLPLRKLGFEIVVGDIRDPDAILALTKESEGAYLFHLAGIIHPPGRTHYFHDINTNGTQALLQAACDEGIKKFIVMSSNSPCGCNPNPNHQFTEESPYNPYMQYGHSKWQMELALKKQMTLSSTPEITILRAPWFYGPGQPPRQTQFFEMIRAGKFPLMGKGENKRSMGYIDSLVLGTLLAASHQGAVGETFWLADEKPYSMYEIVHTVREVLQQDFNFTVSPKVLRVPSMISDVARMADASLQKIGLYHQKIHVLSEMNQTIACDISKAKKLLDFTPLVSLREGMRRSVEWCLQQGLLHR